MAVKAKATKRINLKDRNIKPGQVAEFTDKQAEIYKFALTDFEEVNKKKGTSDKSKKTSSQKETG